VANVANLKEAARQSMHLLSLSKLEYVSDNTFWKNQI